MLDAYIIYNNPKIKDYLKNKIKLKNTVYLHFIDEDTLEGKKQAYKIKGEFAARLLPFIGIFKNDHIWKGFYSEASNNVIEDFIKFINEET